MSTSSLDRWVKGAVPDAITALTLADVLGVRLRWLISGFGERNIETEEEVDDQRILLAKYDLSAFTENFRPPPFEYIWLRKDWLNRLTRGPSRIWLADMPSAAMPSVAREGDTLICQDIEPPVVDGNVYLFFIRSDLVVKRLQIRPEGLILRSDDALVGTIVVTPDQAQYVTPIARVLGAIAIKPV